MRLIFLSFWSRLLSQRIGMMWMLTVQLWESKWVNNGEWRFLMRIERDRLNGSLLSTTFPGSSDPFPTVFSDPPTSPLQLIACVHTYLPISVSSVRLTMLR